MGGCNHGSKCSGSLKTGNFVSQLSILLTSQELCYVELVFSFILWCAK
jgi:hypothetical protein